MNGVSKGPNGRASGLVLTSGFLTVLDHTGKEKIGQAAHLTILKEFSMMKNAHGLTQKSIRFDL